MASRTASVSSGRVFHCPAALRKAPGRRRLFGTGLCRLTQRVSLLWYWLTGQALPFCGLSRCVDALFCPGRRLRRSLFRPGRNRLSPGDLAPAEARSHEDLHHAASRFPDMPSGRIPSPSFVPASAPSGASAKGQILSPCGCLWRPHPGCAAWLQPPRPLNFAAPGGIFIPDFFRNTLDLPHAMLAYFFHFMAERFNACAARCDRFFRA